MHSSCCVPGHLSNSVFRSEKVKWTLPMEEPVSVVSINLQFLLPVTFKSKCRLVNKKAKCSAVWGRFLRYTAAPSSFLPALVSITLSVGRLGQKTHTQNHCTLEQQFPQPSDVVQDNSSHMAAKLQNVANGKLGSSALFLLEVIEEALQICSRAPLIKHSRTGALHCFCIYLTLILAGGMTGLYHLIITFISSPNVRCISCWKYVLRSLCCALKLVLSNSPGKIFFLRIHRPIACHLCLYPECAWYHPVPVSQGCLWSSCTCTVKGPSHDLMDYRSTEHGMRMYGCSMHNSGPLYTGVGPHARSSRIPNVLKIVAQVAL